MINFVRDHKRNVALLLVFAMGGTWLAAGWAGEHKLRMEHRDIYLSRINEQQQTIVGLMSANAILMGTWQNEKKQSEELESQVHRANGRLGPMQRRINDLEGSVERMRNSWTSEIGVEP